ncbi:MAG: hypothetical protein LUD68_07480 [Rikenellaceae bacterium]|nr:hypothetical protein [Rikenellaceae bacterium]
MKEELKKGYRLTRQEQQLVEGPWSDPEITDSQNSKQVPSGGAEKPKRTAARTLGSLLPLLIAFGLMIGIAYLFIWLLHTPERRAERAAREQNQTHEVLETHRNITEREFMIRELALTEEELPVFLHLDSLYREQVRQIREEYTQWTEIEGKMHGTRANFSTEKRPISLFLKNLTRPRVAFWKPWRCCWASNAH